MAEAADSFASMKFILNNGNQVPAIGMGTYRIRNESDIMKVVDYALDAGYRMFDTASVYGNERHLKEALNTLLPKYGLEREDIFITTKLSPSDYGKTEIVEQAYRKSLNNLGLDYVDLYLIHFPGAARLNATDERNKKLRSDTWSALEELYDNGQVNAIGVSNFTVNHLQELIRNHSVIPAVNQVEWHPYYYSESLLDFCKGENILLQAYCSLGGTSSTNNELLEDPVVKRTAHKLKVTCAQILLVWALQKNVAIIPKSTNPQRIKENISLNFRIPDVDMRSLDQLKSKNTKYAWDPTHVA